MIFTQIFKIQKTSLVTKMSRRKSNKIKKTDTEKTQAASKER